MSEEKRLKHGLEGVMDSTVDDHIEKKSASSVSSDKSVVQTKDGYKHTKLGWIPEEWLIEKIDQIASVTGGYAFKSNKMLSSKSEYQILKMSNVYQGVLDLSRNPSFWKQPTEREKEYLLVKGDIVLTLTGTVGKRDFGFATQINDEKNLLLNQRLCKISSKESTSNPFLYYLLKSERFLYYFFLSSRGGTGNQANVGTNDVKSIYVLSPPLPEQQKIAHILSTWDKAITKTEELINQKQKRKQGLMQQLLTGKKRFKEFVKSDKMKDTKLGLIPEDWSIIKVSDVFEFISTNSFSRSQMHYNHGESFTYNIHYGDIHATYKEPILDFELEESIPSLIESFEPSNTKSYLKEGDVVIADASEDYEGVGEAVELKNIANRKVLAGLHTFALRDFSSQTSIGFRAYIFKNPRVSKAIKVIATGSKVFGISKANLTKFELILPPLEEQEKIAQVFASADKEISRLQAELDRLKDQKKGLMQKLLTGEVRVKV